MIIYEQFDNYRIIVYQEDLIQLGKSIDQVIEDMIEASALVGKPLKGYTYEHNFYDHSYLVFIEKGETANGKNNILW